MVKHGKGEAVITFNEARNIMLPILDMYQREANVRLEGRGREKYQKLADALNLLILSSPL